MTIEGIYLDREPENDRTRLTGFVVYFRMQGRHGPHRIAPFTRCTMPLIRQMADSRRGWEGADAPAPPHRVFIISGATSEDALRADEQGGAR